MLLTCVAVHRNNLTEWFLCSRRTVLWTGLIELSKQTKCNWFGEWRINQISCQMLLTCIAVHRNNLTEWFLCSRRTVLLTNRIELNWIELRGDSVSSTEWRAVAAGGSGSGTGSRVVAARVRMKLAGTKTFKSGRGGVTGRQRDWKLGGKSVWLAGLFPINNFEMPDVFQYWSLQQHFCRTQTWLNFRQTRVAA